MDLLLGGFLDFLDDVIGAGRYVLALTADHGVVPIPPLPGEPPGRRVSSAGRLDPGEVVRAVEAALDRTFGAADWVLALEGPNLYLDRHVPPADGHAAEAIERVAARAAMGVRGLFLAVPRTALLDGRPPATPLAKRIANGFHPRHSGDVIVVRRAGWHRPISGRTRTGHGGVWAHETHVPLILAGPGIRQGSSAERVSSLDLAPTLSRLLAIPYPSGCQGEPLAEALRPITPWPDKGP